MKKIILSLVVMLAAATGARAESWPTLDQYVRMCSLIIQCEVDVVRSQHVFKVVETWKGKYNPKDFNRFLRARILKPEYLPTSLGLHSGRKTKSGQKVVFFFTRSVDPPQKEYDGSSTSFEVIDGKLTYAETSFDMQKKWLNPSFSTGFLRRVTGP